MTRARPPAPRARPWQMNAVERRRWHRRFVALMHERGARPLGAESFYDWEIDLPAGFGTLRLALEATHGSVYGRFTDPTAVAAAPFGDHNPSSGKWNHHFGKVAAEAADAELRRQLDRLDASLAGAIR